MGKKETECLLTAARCPISIICQSRSLEPFINANPLTDPSMKLFTSKENTMGINIGDVMSTVHTLKDEGASDDDIRNLFKEAKKDGVDPGDIASAVKNGASLDDVKNSLHQREHKAKEKSLSDISEG